MPDPLGDISFTWYYIFIFLIGYFIGSIPFGVIITRLSGYGDITKIGSGNIGATNVLRTGNRKIAFLTLILDICKGLIPTIIILKILNQDLAIVISTGLVIGHILPILLFKKIKENILINIYIILISFLSINIILFGRGLIPSELTLYPRNSTSFAANVHFGNANASPYFENLANISLTVF